MSKPKHTPGPWAVERVTRTMTNVTKNSVTQHLEFKVNGPSRWNEHDARLIAAAPLMLEVAESLLRSMEENTCYTGFGKFDQSAAADFYNQPQIKALVAAIAKATGGAE